MRPKGLDSSEEATFLVLFFCLKKRTLLAAGANYSTTQESRATLRNTPETLRNAPESIRNARASGKNALEGLRNACASVGNIPASVRNTARRSGELG